MKGDAFAAVGAGAIAAIRTRLGEVSLPHKQLAPRAVLKRQNGDLQVTRSTPLSYLGDNNLEVRKLQFGTGPLFAKFRVIVGPRDVPDNAEYTYLVPRHGDWFSQSQRLFPSEADTAEVVGADMNFLLQGRMLLGQENAQQDIVKVPAGLRRLVRSVHGHTATTPALVHRSAATLGKPAPASPLSPVAHCQAFIPPAGRN